MILYVRSGLPCLPNLLLSLNGKVSRATPAAMVSRKQGRVGPGKKRACKKGKKKHDLAKNLKPIVLVDFLTVGWTFSQEFTTWNTSTKSHQSKHQLFRWNCTGTPQLFGHCAKGSTPHRHLDMRVAMTSLWVDHSIYLFNSIYLLIFIHIIDTYSYLHIIHIDT